MSDTITVPLSRPVQAHGSEIDSIRLRRPKGGDLIVCGYPLINIAPSDTPQDDDGNFVDDAPSDIGGEFRVNASAIAKLIARCGDVPASTVKSLDIADFSACMAGIISFLGDGGQAKKSSKPASISPESGDSTLTTS